MHSLFREAMHRVINHTATKTHQSLAQEGTAELKTWALMSKELLHENKGFLETVSQRRRDVLPGKRLALTEVSAQACKSQEVNVIGNRVKGFDLTGPLPEANVSKKKSDQQPFEAKNSERLPLRAGSSSGHPELDVGLMEATCKEVSKELLTGPISEDVPPQGAALTTRFPVRQKDKIRPIDDYKSSMGSSSVTQTEGVTVRTINHIAAMIALGMGMSSQAGRNFGSKANLTATVVDALASVKSHVEQHIPRRVSGELSASVHIYVDASFEPSGFSGLGERLLAAEQETAIRELESLAVLMAISVFKVWLADHRAVIFTDSAAV